MKDYIRFISIKSDVRFGKPCIKGTRITIQDILSWLASGMTTEDIVEDFPELSPEHIRAALAFAADSEGRTRFLAA
nr:DUF433 domain-containing protein [uncultured Arsenicibacter sp.]